MFKTLLFLAVIGLIQATERSLSEPHPDCPAIGHKLLPHEYDCTKFYYCQAGEKFIAARECAPGTEFSAALEVCIHPSLADCNLPGYSTEQTSTSTQAASSTTEAATSTTQAATSTTQAATSTTQAATSTTQAATSTTQAATSTTQAATSTTQATSSTTQATEVTTEDDCEYLDNGCPADFNMHYLLPHETLCRSFYQCVHGEKVLRRCQSGTVYNPAIEACDHPHNIDRTCEEEESSEEDDDLVNDPPQDIVLLPNGCPADYNIFMYLPHNYYCNRYYQCIFGELVERNCGPGTHFSYELQACEHSSLVGCTLPGGDAGEVTTTEATTTTTRRPDFNENGCPSDGSHWLLPHEDDCTLFYYCSWGVKLPDPTQCPGGLHFNAVLQYCDNPADAGCIKCNNCNNCNDVSEDCSEEDDSPVEESDENPGCSGNDCDTTNEVSEETPGCSGNDCEATDEVSDESPECSGNNCNNDSSSEEDLPPAGDDEGVPPTEPEPECDESVEESNKCIEECNVLPWAHEDCDKFWICEGQKPVLVVCSEGLKFNPNSRTCDFACNVDCIRDNVETTAGHDGVRIFLPWDKIDEDVTTLLKLIAH